MTNSSPAFSVIIPCYNAEAYIGALLDSLITTRYPARVVKTGINWDIKSIPLFKEENK